MTPDNNQLQKNQPQQDQPQQNEQQPDEKPKKVIVITDEDSVVLYKKLRAGRAVTLFSFAALLAIFTLLNVLSEKTNLVFLLFQIFPLLIFIPLLRRPTHRTYSWLCFVSLMYFVGIIPLLMGSWSFSYWLITLLVSSLFVAAMMTSRWLQYWNYYLSTKKS
jgi:uncharacterized membrane protein